MKYVFFGTPRFAGIVLKGLLDADMPPSGLVCNPDRPVGRKKTISPPPTKELVRQHSAGTAVKVLQPEKLDGAFVEELRGMQPDVLVVAAYAKIIPRSVLGIPRLGAIGVHPSLLPKYRGPSPIQSAILNGDAETGVTLYLMDEKTDHGPVIAQTRIPLDALTTAYPVLEAKLAEAAARLLVKTMPNVLAGSTRSKAQEEAAATFTKKFTSDDGRVDEDDLVLAENGDITRARAILLKMNAFTPEPGVWTIKDGKRLKLIEGHIQEGALKLIRVQPEGGKPQPY